MGTGLGLGENTQPEALGSIADSQYRWRMDEPATYETRQAARTARMLPTAQ